MNKYLTTLLNVIAIDLTHLTNQYLSSEELKYIDRVLASKQDFEQPFYTTEHGNRLEVLLCFLHAHKAEIIALMQGDRETETLKELYTSSLISGDYDCFRFDLSKFPHSYRPTNRTLKLYRVGRDGECKESLGCSWAKDIDGLGAYCSASSISKSMLESRPVFHIEVDDSEVLFEGNETEHELVLKPEFKYKKLDNLDDQRRSQICS